MKSIATRDGNSKLLPLKKGGNRPSFKQKYWRAKKREEKKKRVDIMAGRMLLAYFVEGLGVILTRGISLQWA